MNLLKSLSDDVFVSYELVCLIILRILYDPQTSKQFELFIPHHVLYYESGCLSDV